MSDYIIEISGNQPYYVEVDNSNLQEIVNLEITRENDVTVEVSTSNTFISFEFPSGYPIEATSGDLSYIRVSGLQDVVDQKMSDHIFAYHLTPVGYLNLDGGSP